MSKTFITRKLIVYQLIAYGILLFLIVGDELFDFPHYLFGAPATPINWPEVAIEAGYVLVLGAVSIYFSLRILRRVKYLEGLLPICSFCKKIRTEEDWKPIEDYIRKHSEAEFSHGLCEECARKHYSDLYDRIRKKK
ncbi:MAG TPA: hypothetical protein VEP69_03910 [Thermodesulfovibrionales bacterium]|nr:hypothetical protein [Thermodesulfovibrionales bacterium]